MLFSFLYFSLILVLSFLVIFLENSIYSLLCLILVFIFSSFYLFVLGFEFISILLILVYVGAIAVLFLFVVMLLDLKQRPITSRSTRHYIIVGFLGLIFFFEILYILVPAFNIQKIKILPYINWFDLFSFTSQSDLYIIGSVMYTKYFHFLLLVGIILLVAMIGAIVLTLNFKTKTKSQSISKQLSRN